MTQSMTLFYAPDVCSLAPHIVLHELGRPFELVRVDLRTKKTANGEDFHRINPKGYVPALRLEDGSLLTETALILRYLGDLRSGGPLAPAGGMERVHFDEWLLFIASELHKGFAPFTIMASPSEESKRWAAARLAARVALIDGAVGDKAYFHGDAFSVLDAYAFWALRKYSALTKTELTPSLQRYIGGLRDRPSVRAAFEAEGLRS